MHIHGLAELTTHPFFDALALAHRDARRGDGPGRRLIRIRPVDRAKAREHLLEAADHRIPFRHVRPPTAVDVEAEDAGRLLAYRVAGRIPVDVSMDETRVVLSQAHPGGRPVAVGEIGEMQVPFRLV